MGSLSSSRLDLLTTFDVSVRLPVYDATRYKTSVQANALLISLVSPARPLSQSMSVNVLHQDHTVAVTRSGAGVPHYFRVLRIAFVVSTYLTLSWIPRMVALLFYPHLVDPAFSAVYCYRKRLVSRPTSI